MHDLCPRCGTARIGAFRFCRNCRFDFDERGADPAPRSSGRPQPTVGEAQPLAVAGQRWAPARVLLVLMSALAVGVAGLSTGGMPNVGSPSSASSIAEATPPGEHLIAGAPHATPRGTLETTADLGAGPNGTTTRARVVRVIDGNTILVAYGGKRHEVRYLGLSTPAVVGRRATAANAGLVAGTSVLLEADVSGVDRSGRLLRYVWVQHGSGWTLVNLELVRRGLAKVATHAPDTKYAGVLVAAEKRARDRHLGVWAPGPKPKPAKPSKSPKAATPPVSPSPSNHR